MEIQRKQIAENSERLKEKLYLDYLVSLFLKLDLYLILIYLEKNQWKRRKERVEKKLSELSNRPGIEIWVYDKSKERPGKE